MAGPRVAASLQLWSAQFLGLRCSDCPQDPTSPGSDNPVRSNLDTPQCLYMLNEICVCILLGGGDRVGVPSAFCHHHLKRGNVSINISAKHTMCDWFLKHSSLFSAQILNLKVMTQLFDCFTLPSISTDLQSMHVNLLSVQE